jgi:hypothetical protein
MTEPTGRNSLRITEFAITNFRTFRERTVIPLSTGGRADPLVVFHGDNGAGKSNALAALDLFFRAMTHWLGWRAATPSSIGPYPLLRCQWEKTYEFFTPKQRDWPPGSTEEMQVEVRFADQSLRMVLSPAGSDVFLDARVAVEDEGQWSDHLEVEPYRAKQLKSLLETPLGPQSRPLFILDEHRRGSWRRDDPYQAETLETLAPLLAERLLSLRLSLEPIDRQRWKAFGALLSRFPTFQGKEVSVDRVQRDSVPELFFEDPGKQILRLVELSSGEQQLVTLCAAILTSRASIIAIAEPEMSLSESNQRILRDILEEQVRSGVIDQIIMESHVYYFDGPEVIRFKREGSTTRVTREPRAREEAEVSTRAQAAGAQKQYVTPEGFTKIPENMRRDLGLEAGGRLWFLKDDRKRWSAWKTDELDTLFGLSGKPPEES